MYADRRVGLSEEKVYADRRAGFSEERGLTYETVERLEREDW